MTDIQAIVSLFSKKYFTSFSHIFVLALFIVTVNSLRAQKCEWLGVGGGVPHEITQVIAVDENNNAIIGGFYSDSFTVQSHFIPRPTNSSSSVFLIKYGPDSVIKWVKTIRHTSTGSNHSSGIVSISTDVNNNFYITGYFTGNIDFGNSVTLSNGTQGTTFLAKYDSTGTALWAETIQTGGGQSSGKTVIDAAGNVYYAFFFAVSAAFSGTTQTLSTSSSSTTEFDFGVVKYTSSGGFIKATKFGSSDREYVTDMGIDAANNLYILGTSFTSFIFGASNLNGLGEVVLKLDTALTPIKGIKNNLNTGTAFLSTFGIAVQANGNFAVVNNFKDSVNFGNNIWLKSPWSSSTSYAHSLAIVFYDSAMKALWARTNDSVPSQSFPPNISAFAGVALRNDNIYFGGAMMQASTRVGSIPMNYAGGNQKLFVVKMDTLGNFLWAFVNEDPNGRSTLWACDPDNLGNVYVTGNYYSKITVFDKSANGFYSANQSDYFIAKISDYTITRGYVKSGPYCAGDTLKVPYTKQGVYNIDNEFIAQLSDSAGNFDGGHRELGRVKDTAAGIINGFLPLFNVATTNKYRIRIISTSPVVQSYYKFDTLRLLIYSKDSANAGPDTAVCRGASIRLGTTGGSRWNWSPATFMPNVTDTANRQPLIKPDSAVEYRIIISDSSGCGDVDTDYVKVTLLPYIDVSVTGDSMICRGFGQTLKAIVTGGNKKYWYQWKTVGLNIVQSRTDSLFVNPYNTTKYMVAVGDSCSSKIDTAFFTIHVGTVLNALTSPDTVICKGSSATLTVTGDACNPKYYKYQWYEAGNTTEIGNTATLTVTPATTTTYQVILSDTSTTLKDTAEIKVTVDNVFTVNVSKDNTICIGQSIILKADVISCDTSQMEYTWDNGLGDGPVKTVSPTTTTTYIVKGTNKFNGLSDTAKVTITVRPPLDITLNADTTICIGETAELRATTSGGDGPNHNVVWSEVGGQWSVGGKMAVVSPTKTTTYRAVLTDNCTVEGDSAEITVTVRPPLKVAVNADTTICIGESAELRAGITGGYVPNHSVVWKEVGGQWSVVSGNATVNPVVTTTYRAVLTDNCTTPGDSAELTVNVRPPLKVTVNPDTTICVGETAELRATITGGYTPNHVVVWTEVGGQSTVNSPQTTVNPITTTTYRAILTDNCTTPGDSAEVTVTVRPPLQISATSSSDSICGNQTVVLTANFSGGYSAGYSLLWTSDHGLLTNQNPASDQPQITTTYIARLSDNCSPDVYDTLIVFVLPVPKADFSINPKQGCPPLKVTLTDLSADHDTTLNTWKVQATEAKGITQYTHEFTQTGVYNVGLTVSNSLGCVDQKTVNSAVTVFEKPTAQFIAKPDIKEIESPIYLYHQSSRAISYTWDFGDGNLLHQNNNNDTLYSYTDTGTMSIRLIAENARGCVDTQTQVFRIYDKINCVIPNAFTPNNLDNLNPTFAPVCVGAASYQMTIFNRWGQVIQSCENCAWDGTFSGNPVPPGVYLYKLIITAESKKEATSFGTVNVVR